MELVYLYVQRFGQTTRVKQREFMFSPNHRCVSEVQSRTRIKFELTEETVVPVDFFPSHISNVSFIVGRNGVGKTILIELLRYVLSLKDPRTRMMGSEVADSRLFVVFRTESGAYYAHSSLDYGTVRHSRPKNVLCTVDGQDIPVNQLLERGLVHGDWHLRPDLDNYPNIATISYSPIFNLRDYNFSFSDPGYVDVTSNFLVQVDKDHEKIPDPILAHRRADVRRALRFIYRAKHVSSGWSRSFMRQFIPDRVLLKVITKLDSEGIPEMRYMGFDAMAAYSVLKKHYLITRSNLQSDLRSEGSSPERHRTALSLFRLEVLMAAIDGLFNMLEHRRSGSSKQKHYRFDLFQGRLSISKTSGEQPLIEFLRRQHAIPKPVVENWLNHLRKIQKEVELNDRDEVQFKIPVELGVDMLLVDGLLRLVPGNYTEQFRPLMNFDWSDISSGQKMMLDMFSRLYYAHEVIKERNDQHNAICLLLDEPEVGFHPHWQREWFKELLAFTDRLANVRFNADGSRGKKYQIIVATNNPMSLSDIPGPCVQYFGRSEEAPKTFAANIHELLGDSFYLQDGFIGEFAKEKLEKLIKFLTTSKAGRTKLWNEESALQVINLVGDKVIQQRLTDLYYLKYPERLPTSAQEIERLEERLRRLKAGPVQ